MPIIPTKPSCSETDYARPHKQFIRKGWLVTTLTYLLYGVGLGLVIHVVLSAYRSEWLGLRQLLFNVLFSSAISVSITNTIFFSQRLFRLSALNPVVVVLVYYAGSLFGMFVGIESVYFILSVIFNTPYTFFHRQDLFFCMVITLIVCTVMYVRGAQKQRLMSQLKEKELDLLRLSQVSTQAELAALQARINPHFLYNSLNAIASLIHTDPDKAESMTLKLSTLFRYTINHKMENVVTVEEEMEIVSAYLDIERVRFGDRIRFDIEVDPATLSLKIPRFLIQPLLENALKHGLQHLAANGWLRVRIRGGENLEISIADNGTPFPDNYEIGYGLQSTYDKLALLYPGRYEVYIRNRPEKEILLVIPRSDG